METAFCLQKMDDPRREDAVHTSLAKQSQRGLVSVLDNLDS